MASPVFSVDLKFKDEYRVNHHAIDKQHEQLFLMAGEIINLHLQNRDQSLIIKKLRSLYTGLEEHFAFEESVMEACGYPEKQVHHNLHQDLLVRTARFLARYEAEVISLGDLYGFLHGAILQQHFLKDDKKFCDYLHGKNLTDMAGCICQ